MDNIKVLLCLVEVFIYHPTLEKIGYFRQGMEHLPTNPGEKSLCRPLVNTKLRFLQATTCMYLLTSV